MTTERILLAALTEGQSATVVEIAANQTTAKRLADMGFSRGETVEMLRPGRPCLVRIGRTCIGLGRDIQLVVVLERDQSNGRQRPAVNETS